LGYARLGDHARERLGVSVRSLQEWARLGAQLERLPKLDAALVSDRLSWSQVRILARFVVPEDEEHWIAFAEGKSVRRLERELRAVDRGALMLDAGEDHEPVGWVRIQVPAPLAFKWQRTRQYAEKVNGHSLSDGQVLETVAAEVTSALPVVPTDEPVCTEAIRSSREDLSDSWVLEAPPSRPRLDQGLSAFLQPLVAGLAEADAFELEERLRRVVRLEQRLDAQLAPLLREATAPGFEWRGGYASLTMIARECLGMSASKARALLRVERLGDGCPDLRDAFREGRLSWVQAQILGRLLESAAEDETDWRAAWVRFATTVTVRKLTEAVERARLWRTANPAGFDAHRSSPATFAEPDPAEFEGLRQTCARPTDVLGGVRLRVAAPQSVARRFHAVLCAVRRAMEASTGRLPAEADGFEAMLDHALESWAVDDAWLRRSIGKRHHAVLERDDWRCVFPGCTSRRNLHVHHIRFRSAGGSDEPSNLMTLCAFHHQRGVHGGTVTVTGRAPDALEFGLGIRPGRAPLARFRSGDRVV
jgi:hypothetical protein